MNTFAKLLLLFTTDDLWTTEGFRYILNNLCRFGSSFPNDTGLQGSTQKGDWRTNSGWGRREDGVMARQGRSSENWAGKDQSRVWGTRAGKFVWAATKLGWGGAQAAWKARRGVFNVLPFFPSLGPRWRSFSCPAPLEPQARSRPVNGWRCPKPGH
jgi:hypothetical protein